MAYKNKNTLRLYRCFSEQKYRCENPNNPSYPNYGGRGIKFLFTSFSDWLNALGPKPNGTYSVDRIDNMGHYEVGNVRWATKKIQGNNKRIYKTNKFGISGISYSKQHNYYVCQYQKTIYYRGQDFFEACCIRKSMESRMP